MSDDFALLGKQGTESAIHRRAIFSKYQLLMGVGGHREAHTI